MGQNMLLKLQPGTIMGSSRPRAEPEPKTPTSFSRNPSSPMDIGQALLMYCKVRHKAYALLTENDAGELVAHTSPSIRDHEGVIFNPESCDAFSTAVRQAEAQGYLQDAWTSPHLRADQAPGLTPRRSSVARPPLSSSSLTNLTRSGELPLRGKMESKRGTKRRKSSKLSKRDPDLSDSDDECYFKNTPNRQLRIGDEAAVNEFYFSRFGDLQQLYCKVVAKAWIKKIEPRKQTTHPYKNGDAAAPPWWPAGVTHREPDHIRKHDRKKLLQVMLQCKRQPVSELEKATDAVQNLINADKRPILADIYRVAKQQERYWRNEIDGDTGISIGPRSSGSDDDDEDDDDPMVGAEQIDPPGVDTPNRSPSPTPVNFHQPVAPRENPTDATAAAAAAHSSRRTSVCGPSQSSDPSQSVLASPINHLHLQSSSSPERLRNQQHPVVADERGLPMPDSRRPSVSYIDTSLTYRAQQQQAMQTSAAEELCGTSYVVGGGGGAAHSLPVSPRSTAAPRNSPAYWTQPASAEFRRDYQAEGVTSSLSHSWSQQPMDYEFGGPIYGSQSAATAMPRDAAQTRLPGISSCSARNGGSGLSFLPTQGISAPSFVSTLGAQGQPTTQAGFDAPTSTEPHRSGTAGDTTQQPTYTHLLYHDGL